MGGRWGASSTRGPTPPRWWSGRGSSPDEVPRRSEGPAMTGPVRVRGRRLRIRFPAALGILCALTTGPLGAQQAAAPRGPAGLPSRLQERAGQTREIVYFLRQPESHAFDLYHDYTESREGVDKYLNVVRAGSTVSNTSAVVLDTGERLETRVLRGGEITREGLDIGEPVKPETEVVVIPFPAVRTGRSIRLRISETYTDSARYRLEGEELVWDRGFGRPANAVVLPAGWYLTQSAVPATVSLTDDGRIRLDFMNPRLDEIQVLIVAKRRGPWLGRPRAADWESTR